MSSALALNAIPLASPYDIINHDRTPLQEPILVEALGFGQQQQRLELLREGGFGQGQVFQKER